MAAILRYRPSCRRNTNSAAMAPQCLAGRDRGTAPTSEAWMPILGMHVCACACVRAHSLIGGGSRIVLRSHLELEPRTCGNGCAMPRRTKRV